MNKFLLYFSSEKNISDQLFYVAFYVCLGLLPPVMSLIGLKSTVTPFLIISTLIVLRFLMRPLCRNRMVSYIKSSPAVWLFFALIFLIIFYLILDPSNNLEKTKIIGIPLMFFLIISTLVFVWSHDELIDKSLLIHLATIGFWVGLGVTILKMSITMSMGVGGIYDPTILVKLLHIDHKINAELVTLSFFCFIVWSKIEKTEKYHILLFILYFSIFLLSFFTIGFRRYIDGFVMLKAASETVQFGIPIVLLVLMLSYKYSKAMINVVFIFIGFVLISGPWLYQLSYWVLKQEYILPHINKIMVRSEIWDGVSQKILESPLLGGGIDSLRGINHINLANNYMLHNNLWHPHNMILQLWLDLGLVSVLIISSLLYLGWSRVRKMNEKIIPSILSAFVMMVIMIVVAHSLWRYEILAIITNVIIVMSVYGSRSTCNPVIFPK